MKEKKLKAIFGADWNRLDDEEKANAGNLLAMRESNPDSTFTDENIKHFATNPQGRIAVEDEQRAREEAAQAERERQEAERIAAEAAAQVERELLAAETAEPPVSA